MKTSPLTFALTLTAAAMLAGMSLTLTAQEKPAPPVQVAPQVQPAPPAKIPTDDPNFQHLQALMELAKTDKKKAIQQIMEGLEKSPAEGLWGMELATIFKMDEVNVRREAGQVRTNVFTEGVEYLSKGKTLLENALKTQPANESLNYQLKAVQGALATALLESGNTAGAKKLAEEQLAANTDPKDWNYGNVIHEANALLGRAALRDGDKKAAAEYLLKAGATPGSPQLNSFGPDFTLAREMVELGETKAVLDYFDLVEKFWVDKGRGKPLAEQVSARNKVKLDGWRADIAAGQTPKFQP